MVKESRAFWKWSTFSNQCVFISKFDRCCENALKSMLFQMKIPQCKCNLKQDTIVHAEMWCLSQDSGVVESISKRVSQAQVKNSGGNEPEVGWLWVFNYNIFFVNQELVLADQDFVEWIGFVFAWWLQKVYSLTFLSNIGGCTTLNMR